MHYCRSLWIWQPSALSFVLCEFFLQSLISLFHGLEPGPWNRQHLVKVIRWRPQRWEQQNDTKWSNRRILRHPPNPNAFALLPRCHHSCPGASSWQVFDTWRNRWTHDITWPHFTDWADKMRDIMRRAWVSDALSRSRDVAVSSRSKNFRFDISPSLHTDKTSVKIKSCVDVLNCKNGNWRSLHCLRRIQLRSNLSSSASLLWYSCEPSRSRCPTWPLGFTTWKCKENHGRPVFHGSAKNL